MMPLSRFTVMCTVHFLFWYCYCWTVKSDGDCQLITPVHKVSFLSFLLVSGLAMLCHFMVSYHPCPQRSRETGTVFQSLKLIQTVSNSCWNFSNMFVAELVVLASVNYPIWHYLEGLLAYSYSQGVKHNEWLALCHEYVYAQQEHCTGVVSSCAW